MFQLVQNLISQIPQIVPQPILAVVGALFLLGWGYSILHLALHVKDMETRAEKVLWTAIVLFVPFGFMFYLTSQVEWEK